MITRYEQALESDVQAIVDLLAADPLGSQREGLAPDLHQKYQSAFQRIDQDSNQELWTVKSEEGEVIGCFQLSFLQYLTYQGGLRAQIEGVRLKESVRGQGLGQEMFEWAIARSKEKGAHLLQLTTDKKRPEALKFYQKLGFVASHEGMKLHF
ncbi:GNAT family N-acetyltransferase [Aureicoccus marinus]|uniref:GNAT family N-acetyltransferase n=1 Tax=Aureicoccus marinus TaxID=754435 RepID=A0A2S7T871_9FLAO|nr:GNAT family N-acetyltransferase [Aureicoccus marinus]PQJ16130.1 GNAT family N-acetyltransferase [Aureicoccus marinus]